ncbi:MAG: LacI family DNA-binding transcriptional regulator [Cytophagales bacterium]|nr:LacI family DNA-binding transcriptional regulator [Armatimonadota bacterium]
MGASIREVAREANVSLSTVSKVLNAKPECQVRRRYPRARLQRRKAGRVPP